MSSDRTNRDYFSKWYENNKAILAQKRKERYHSDPNYRAKALQNRVKQLERQRDISPLNPDYTTTFSEAAKELGISVWRLRTWRENNYFPEPYSYGKFLYFTDHQVELLKAINQFIGDKPRLSQKEKERLTDVTDLVFANWAI